MAKKHTAYIGLGSNIKQPSLQIKNAMMALHEMPAITVIKDSGYYKSRPMGPEDQPDFVNAVVQVETALSAVELLEHCQIIEQQQGRIKTRHWGERCIDLDILLYADKQFETDDLTVPHPGICQRDFVYMPLLKLNPEIEIPGIGLLSQAVAMSDIEAAAKKDETDYGCQFAGNIQEI